MDTAVRSSQFYSILTSTLNCTLRGIFVVIVEKMHVLHKMQFMAQFYSSVVHQNSQLRSAATLFNDLRFLQYIYS